MMLNLKEMSHSDAPTPIMYKGCEFHCTGEVYSCSTNWRGYGKRKMNYSTNKDGYYYVRVTDAGRRQKIYIHKIVCTLFNGEMPDGTDQVRHLDGNKTNNSYLNLKWGTAKENAIDRELHKRTSRGERHSIVIKNSLTKL